MPAQLAIKLALQDPASTSVTNSSSISCLFLSGLSSSAVTKTSPEFLFLPTECLIGPAFEADVIQGVLKGCEIAPPENATDEHQVHLGLPVQLGAPAFVTDEIPGFLEGFVTVLNMVCKSGEPEAPSFPFD